MNIEIEKYINFLNTFDDDLNSQNLEKFINALTVQTFKKGSKYLSSGKIPSEFAFISLGLVRSHIIDDLGNEKTINFFVENNYVGDYNAMTNQIPTQYHFQFLENSTLIIIPNKLLKEHLQLVPNLEKHCRILAEEKLKTQNARLKLFLTHTAEERYQYFMKNYPEVFKRVSVSHLSSYLGIERQSLTRIRKNICQLKRGCLKSQNR